ncbi:hypothetical protein TNCV_2455011 [Trichonephila clavipes]|nr:hypothetical protein TNCV_2455011 [Trichonephila clavipes]
MRSRKAASHFPVFEEMRKAGDTCPKEIELVSIAVTECTIVCSIGPNGLRGVVRISGFVSLWKKNDIFTICVCLGKYENPVNRTVATHVGAPVSWGPRIIDTADTAVATPLVLSRSRSTSGFSRHFGVTA